MSLHNKVATSLLSRFKNVVKNKRVGQAYLLNGDSLAELEAFLQSLLPLIMCDSLGVDGDPCGMCRKCDRLDAGIYEYYYDLRPRSKTRMIVIEHLNEFQRKFNLKVPAGFLKVGVIVEADRMVDQAQNAFLKTLEEPADGTLFLLLTTNPKGLLPTIQSRCQLLSISENRLDYSSLVNPKFLESLARLKKGAGAKVALEVCAEISEVLSNLEKKATEDGKEFKARLLEGWDEVSSDRKKKVEGEVAAFIAAEYRRGREGVLSVLETWFSQLAILASGAQVEDLSHRDLLIAIDDDFVKGLDCASLLGQLAAVDALKSDLNSHVNEALALDNFCLQVCRA